MALSKDTIVAPATPPGRSGVAVVRLSGPRAFSLLHKLTRLPLKRIISRKVHFARIHNATGVRLDECLVWASRGPKTYTGEDVAEISTHGNPIVVHQIIEAALRAGARLAERGEFTKRAFLSGRLDLAQAEAVAQLIGARSSAAATAALLHLEGALSKEIKEQRKRLLELLARIEAALDFPDEIKEIPAAQIKEVLKNVQRDIQALLRTDRQGALLKEGLKVVIAGGPNVGKSSLWNALAGEPKAIVTEVPGTTRDALEEVVTLDGVPLCIIDTAGLRHSEDVVEKLGIERTLAHVETADLVLFIVDASRSISEVEHQKIKELKARKIRTIVVGNKADLLPGERKKIKVDLLLSAKTGAGLERLKKMVLKRAGWILPQTSSSPLLMELRHKEKLFEASAALERMQQALATGDAQDLLTIDLKAALIALGEITGEEVSEEVIEQIFERFCVGK